jgi:hypothetical protein
MYRRMKGRYVKREVKCLEGSGRGLILRHYPGIHLEGLRKAMKIRSQDSRSPGRGLKQGPPEHETEVSITRPRC